MISATIFGPVPSFMTILKNKLFIFNMMPLIYPISGILIIDIFVQIFQNSLNNRFEKSPINLFFYLVLFTNYNPTPNNKKVCNQAGKRKA